MIFYSIKYCIRKGQTYCEVRTENHGSPARQPGYPNVSHNIK